MIALVLKNWKLILDILLVAAAVILVFLWNPLGMFGGGLKLQNTANMVSEIKEIGQLITAEYYGEVIASEPEASLGIVDKDTVEEQGEQFYLGLKEMLFDVYQKEASEIIKKFDDKNWSLDRINRRTEKELRKNLMSNYLKDIEKTNKLDSFQNAIGSKYYYPLMIHIAKFEQGIKVKNDKVARQAVKGKNSYFERVVIKNVLSKEFEKLKKQDDGDVSFEGYDTQGFTATATFSNSFTEYYASKQDKERKEDFEVAIIGRGSVKAGFDFGELDDNNFVYDEDRQMIHFFGFRAKILNQDINPWFIPERQVPGFQILNVKNAGFEDMKRVKIHCVKKLVDRAKKANIEEQAQTNGEEALKEFFSLLVGEEIQSVIFHEDQLLHQSKEILKDSVIDFSELSLVDSLVKKNITAIKEEKSIALKNRRVKLLKELIWKLKERPIVFKKNDITYKYPFNYYTRHFHRFFQDTIVTQDEIEEIRTSLRHALVVGTGYTYQSPPDHYAYWFEDSLQYLNEFNVFVDTLCSTKAFKGFFSMVPLEDQRIQMPPDTGTITQNSADWDLFNNEKKELIESNQDKKDFQFTYEYEGDYLQFYQLKKEPKPWDLKYPINDTDSLTQRFIEIDKVLDVWQVETSDTVPAYTLLKRVIKDTLLSTADSLPSSVETLFSSVAFDAKLFDSDSYDVAISSKLEPKTIADKAFILDTIPAQVNYMLTTDASADSMILQHFKRDSVDLLAQLDAVNYTSNYSIELDSLKLTLGPKATDKLSSGISRVMEVLELNDQYYVADEGNTEEYKSIRLLVCLTGVETYSWVALPPEQQIFSPDQLAAVARADVSKPIELLLMNTFAPVTLYRAPVIEQESDAWIKHRTREIIALRQYLIQRNADYQGGPVIKARRRVQRFIKDYQKADSTVEGVKKKFGEWGQSLQETIGIGPG